MKNHITTLSTFCTLDIVIFHEIQNLLKFLQIQRTEEKLCWVVKQSWSAKADYYLSYKSFEHIDNFLRFLE